MYSNTVAITLSKFSTKPDYTADTQLFLWLKGQNVIYLIIFLLNSSTIPNIFFLYFPHTILLEN